MAYGNNTYGSTSLGGELLTVISKSIEDTGSGTEVLSLLAQATLTETGSGVDVISVLAELLVLDISSGVDTVANILA